MQPNKQKKKAHSVLSLLLCLLVCAARYHFFGQNTENKESPHAFEMFTFFHVLASFQKIRCVNIPGAEMFVGLKPVFKTHAPLLLTLPPTPFGCYTTSPSLSLFKTTHHLRVRPWAPVPSADVCRACMISEQMMLPSSFWARRGVCEGGEKKASWRRVKKLAEPLGFRLTQSGTELIKHQLCSVRFYIATPTSLLDRGPAPHVVFHWFL